MSAKILKLLFNITVLVLPLIFLYLLMAADGFSPLITNSISFDAKIAELNHQKFKRVDILGLGSSMTLNNINSQIVADSLSSNYYNISSWGLQMSDLNSLAHYYVPKFKPKYILMLSSVTDFRVTGNETID